MVQQKSKEFKTRLTAQKKATAAETKQREKAAGSSIKAGIKSALKSAFGSGQASKAKEKIQKDKARTRKSLDY